VVKQSLAVAGPRRSYDVKLQQHGLAGPVAELGICIMLAVLPLPPQGKAKESATREDKYWEVGIWEVIAIAHEGQLGTDPTDGNLLFPPSGGSRAEKHGQES